MIRIVTVNGYDHRYTYIKYTFFTNNELDLRCEIFGKGLATYAFIQHCHQSYFRQTSD